MYFQVQKSGDTLDIKSDTYWSCNVYGNIRLSQYSGSGNTGITILIPEDMSFGNGRVIFSYGDGRCDYPSIDVYITNNCWIRTIPMFQTRIEDGIIIREINIPFTEDNEAINMKVFSNTGWYIKDNNAYINDEDVLMQAEDGKEVVIKFFNCDKEIKVTLCKKNGVT